MPRPGWLGLLLSLGTGLAKLALAQPPPAASPAETVRRLNTDVAYSLFLLSNGAFSSLGSFKFSDQDNSAKLNVLRLPLTFRLEPGLLGPVVLRLEAGYGEAKSLSRDAASVERQFMSLWMFRLYAGRPIELVPDLVLTPGVGLGVQRWSGKLSTSGPVPAAADRTTFWADSLLAEAGASLEYRYGWGELNLRPGFSATYVNLSAIDGRASVFPPSPAASQRGTAFIAAESAVLRAAFSIDGPLGIRVGPAGLRWQGFVIGNYSTADVGLFRWTVEIGAAIGVELGPFGRRRLGFDPGSLFLGVSYIAGENLSGVRANFGFSF